MVERFIGPAAVLGERLLAELRDAASSAHVGRRGFSLALSGGSVATTFLPMVAAQARFDWSATDVFFADERAVPPADPESNYGLARSLWFDSARVPAGRVHRMPADQPDLARAAAAHEQELRRLVGEDTVLDVVLLGLGPDGHVASLFPGHPLLEDTAHRVAAVTDSPKPPPRRLTLTLPVLTAARLVVIGAFGEGKSAVAADVLTNRDSQLPAALGTRGAARVLWLLDNAAAGTL